MHINVSIAALASSLTTSIASPHVLNQRDEPTPEMSLREQNHRAIDQMPPTCNLVACVGLSGTLNCVLSAISSGDTSALRHCLSGGLGQICSCAACITGVNNFLQSLGICVKTGDDELSDERSDTLPTSAPSSTYVPGSTSRLDDRRIETAAGGQKDTGT